MSGRRWGKSLICQVITCLESMQGKRVAYITPTYLLAKAFFDELALLMPATVAIPNRSDLTFKLITGGSIRFFTGERLDNLRGLKFHYVIIDEASFIPNLEEGWNNAIRPTLTDFQGKAIFLSTPKGKNFFYSLYLKGLDPSGEWESFKYSSYDNPHIADEEIDSARLALPEVVFEQEYMANPAENSANPFGSQALSRCVSAMSQDPVRVFGIDLAKYSDWTVIIGLDGAGNVAYFDRFQSDWASTQNKIRMLPKVPMLVDSTGVGDPVVEQLQREGLAIEGFKFTSQSKQELMLGLQVAIHQEKIHYPAGMIQEELEIFEYQYSANGVKYSAPSGFHDDCVMALALAWRKLDFKAGTGKYNFV
jgi:phage FluMu gp28-like protein